MEASPHDRSKREAKLRAIADTARHQFPTADIEVMLAEIDAGRRLSSAFEAHREQG